MNRIKLVKSILIVAAVALAVPGGAALAQDAGTPDRDQVVERAKPYSPYVDQHFPQQVLFGDMHHHTSLSVDSGLIGNKSGPDVSFRLARGEEVVSNTGQRVKLARPLDFLVVTDHAEYLGIAKLLAEADPALLATDVGKEWYAQMNGSPEDAWGAVVSMQKDFVSGVPRFDNPQVKRSVWEDVVDIASKYNEPGTFTALNGYEWSTISSGKDGTGPAGANLHRCVIFRDGPDRVKQVLPFSAFDSGDPEKLWEFLAEYEKKTGGRVLAIPHNGNISNGQMYAELIKGKRMTRDYAERRARWEPLMEATQMKGDGETHPVLSPEDEFADFETWDFGDSFGNPKEDGMLEYEYARSTLMNGLRLEEKLGANPYKYGMVGSTVDVADASYTNAIGDVMLMAHWKDPDFDPKQRAFYYVRVIEIPTPRWTAYDAKRFGFTMPNEVTMTLQDRAYSSPIWYTP
jgi:hypothetical protein